MVLSYALRVTCMIGVTLALLQVTLETLLWMAGPALLRVAPALPLRLRERAFYLVQLLPVLGAVTLTGIFFLPQYLSSETNLAPEHVGWLCIVLALSFYAWWTAGSIRGVRIVLRTIRFSRACRLQAQDSVPCSSGATIVSVAGNTPRVALVGLLRPFILISRSLLGERGLDPLALQVVLEHERAHAAQRDNWKVLSLRCLPRLNLRLSNGKTWMQLWQSTAEWAADEDAVAGSTARALMLAETLVALARTQSTENRQIACTYLVCADTELAARVERLLHHVPHRRLTQLDKTGLALCLVALGATTMLAASSSVLRFLPEHLLHIG